MVATTNADDVDFDQALKRPGRRLDHIDVGPLSADLATKRLAQMLGVEEVGQGVAFDKPATLAEVYARAARIGGAS